jgi:hypothetical protein
LQEGDLHPSTKCLSKGDDENVEVAGGEAPRLELQPIQIASTPIAIGTVVDDPIEQPASTPIPTSLVSNDPTTQPAPGPTAGEGK